MQMETGGVMREPPKRIWLQYYGDDIEPCDGAADGDTTWCVDKINNHDVEYIRGWQPIETAPRDGTPVDLWHKLGFRQMEVWWDVDDKCWSSASDDSNFTHWMHAPEAPA